MVRCLHVIIYVPVSPEELREDMLAVLRKHKA